jgi:NAD-dependent SIR2 family protein deacetylase
VTRGYHLPARFVVHTVGPQVARGGAPTPTQRHQLAACYTSCLDAASEVGCIRSLAFCCISTGLYGFPQAEASAIATRAVYDWLAAHPDTSLQQVIFNVFRADDEQHYVTSLHQLANGLLPVPLPTPRSVAETEIIRAASWVHDADSLLITGGAGWSAAAGLDYTDEAVFACRHAKLFPQMLKYGFRRMYDFIGFDNWPSEALRWGYLCSQLDLARYKWPLHAVYGNMLKLAKGKDYFVVTSNVDGMAARNGFDADLVYAPQGDYGRLQCLTPCTQAVWDIRPFIDRTLTEVDPDTLMIRDPAAVPKCPNCGGRVIMNVRGGGWYIEEPTVLAAKRFSEWLQQLRATGRKLTVLEIGAGFNTPGVIRERNEGIVMGVVGARFVRINAVAAHVPAAIVDTDTSAQIFGDAAAAIDLLLGTVDASC